MKLQNYMDNKIKENNDNNSGPSTSHTAKSNPSSDNTRKNSRSISDNHITPVTTKYIKEISKVSKMGYQGEGVKKFNQDIYFIYENFNDNPDHIYFGVW